MDVDAELSRLGHKQDTLTRKAAGVLPEFVAEPAPFGEPELILAIDALIQSWPVPMNSREMVEMVLRARSIVLSGGSAE